MPTKRRRRRPKGVDVDRVGQGRVGVGVEGGWVLGVREGNSIILPQTGMLIGYYCEGRYYAACHRGVTWAPAMPVPAMVVMIFPPPPGVPRETIRMR